MKLKSLLLGSAAAMIAVSGARAADAIVAEPEPMEYVKVCDMYGAGFFYIPGTETCLKFSGYVRTDFSYNLDQWQAGSAVPAVAATRNDNIAWNYRARFNIDARNETDWGTVRSQIRIQGDGDGGADAAAGIDRALISLKSGAGEWRTGYSDSFTTTFHGYGLPIEKNDGYYGYDQAIFADYTYSANGFSVGAGLQRSISNAASMNGAPAGSNGLDLDYYVGAKYGGSWGDLALSYIYETDVAEGAFKASTTINIIENLTFRGFYIYDSSGMTRQANNNVVTSTAALSQVMSREWAWGVGARYQLTDELSLSAVYSERDAATDGAGTLLGTRVGDAPANDSFIAVGANWTPVPGLSFRPEARFNDDDSSQYTLRVYRTW